MNRVVRTTYWDILRATLMGVRPEEFLFFNRNSDRQARREGVHQAP